MPLSVDIIAGYYQSIQNQPLAVHESERRKKEIQETLGRTFREKEELFKSEYPWRNVQDPHWSAKITLWDAFLMEPLVSSAIVHT